MNEGAQLKYDWIRGGKEGFIAPIGASEVIKAQSGRFVTNDGSGRFEICGAASTTIDGFLDCEEFTASSTEGEDERKCINDLTAVFRIPINSGTYVSTMLGETCDLSVSSNIQGAALDASSRDLVKIVGGDETNNEWVDVQINPSKLYETGVV